MNFTVRDPALGNVLPLKDIQDFDVGVIYGLGEVIDVGFLDVGLALLIVEFFDKILFALANVNGLGVQGGQGRGKIDFGNHPRFIGGIHHHEIIGTDAAQGDGVAG